MNSFSHYSFGAVGEWMFKTIGGIDTDRAGFKDIIIRPRPGGKLKWAKASYNSINGEIKTNWQIKNGEFVLDVTIPANTGATVFVPTKTKDDVTKAEAEPYVNFIGMENESAVYRIESGSYQFTSRM
jgi:alpha-L-rhamnosidase